MKCLECDKETSKYSNSTYKIGKDNVLCSLICLHKWEERIKEINEEDKKNWGNY